MKHQMTLMGHPITVNIEATATGMHITVDPEQRTSFESYLKRALPYFVTEHGSDDPLNTKDLSFENLLEIAVNYENQSPDIKLAEPTTKLPYDIPVSVKDMLAKLAAAKGVSATQLTINLIQNKYNQVVKK